MSLRLINQCRRLTTNLTSDSKTSLSQSIAKLALQPRFYAKVHIHAQSYIVTKGDLIHLPVKLKGTNVGDVLRLSKVSAFGSRDYTLHNPSEPETINADGTQKTKISPKRETKFVEEDLVNVMATVLEHTKQPMQRTIKKKRRNRHAKLVTNKQNYTVLRIAEVDIKQSHAQ